MPSDQQINPEQVKPVQDRSHRGATRPKRDITLFQRQRQLQKYIGRRIAKFVRFRNDARPTHSREDTK